MMTQQRKNLPPPKAKQQQQQQQQQQHNIAMVCDFFYPRLGGVENHIYSLSYHLVQLGHKVIVITNGYDDIVPDGHNDKLNDNGKRNRRKRRRIGVRYIPGPIKVYYCPFVCMTDQDTVPTFSSSLPLIRSILIREQITIVHAHQATSVMANECIVYASMMDNIRTVYTDHSLFGFNDIASVILNRVLQVSLATVNAVICVSYICRDNFILRTKQNNRMMSFPRRIIHVIPNAVSADKFQPPSPMTKETGKGNNNINNNSNSNIEQNNREQSPFVVDVDSNNNYNDNRIRIVIISRLVYRKGIDLLVGIIPNVCSKYMMVDFVIGGYGNKLLNLQEMVEREQLQHRVQFLGSVPHSQVRNVLCSGHIFLNCSLTESFCIAILEAACTGMIVVSTNVGGVPEVLPSDMIYLANPTVPDLLQQIYNAIQQYQEEQENKQKIASSISSSSCSNDAESSSDTIVNSQHTRKMILHNRVKEIYSWERVAYETIEIYNTICMEPDKTLQHRLKCYYYSGGGSSKSGSISAYVVTFLIIMTIEIWFLIVTWWLPEDKIDKVPNIVSFNKNINVHKAK